MRQVPNEMRLPLTFETASFTWQEGNNGEISEFKLHLNYLCLAFVFTSPVSSVGTALHLELTAVQ